MSHDLSLQTNVQNILQRLDDLQSLRQLFCTELNYTYQNDPIDRGDWNQRDISNTADDPLLFATGGGDFHLIYTRLKSDSLLLTDERPIITRLLRDYPYALFIFSNNNQTHWHFVNAKFDPEHPEKRRLYRRITISPDEKLRTASERIAMLDAESLDSPLEIQSLHDDAFDVEAVTNEFFKSYQSVFQRLQDDLMDQTNDNQWAHDVALQFLNRCMFLYFIQRKGWLDDDPKFLKSFWNSYQTTNQPVNSFVERWLNILFFEAFHENRFHGGHRQFPDEIRKALFSAPYLNGGLFTENDLDNQHVFQISDSRFKDIFKFLEGYNFTIAEDSPIDQEVAVDPEMIGKVYESLVNVSTETDERGDAGIFYTPRTEIDLMCRLALVDNLTNHLGEEHKSLLYETILAIEPDEKADADQRIGDENLWNPLDKCLKKLAIVDPACGSGSFLVGMLHILDDLRTRADRQLGHNQLNFDRKKAIIGENLYGVDVMDWACHVAELRLWLSLIIDADIPRAELQLRNEPLLPHFSFNIRCGDSLLQEIGGMNLAQVRDRFSGVSSGLKGRVTKLKNQKLKFFNNDNTRKFKTEEDVKHEESELFCDLLDERSKAIFDDIGMLQEKIRAANVQQLNLDESTETPDASQPDRETEAWRKQIEALTADRNHLVEVRGALTNAPTSPFVWDIAFVEIFSDEKGGFDIVIGNPPYVRQENIADPKLPRESVTTDNKKAYKAKLARSVYQAFPRFFDYKREKDIRVGNPSAAVSHKLDAKSDLYIYFYFHGLSLLNPEGSFCFITSNSWLDVGYGKDLQEFLLKHCHTKQIIDNQSRRSFASADVNTVICLFSAPDEKRKSGLDKRKTRFVMFKTPFEGVLDAVIFEEVEEANQRTSTEEHRIFPVPQHKLLESGGDYQTSGAFKYTGDKWGGKYLRAPDIYWTILEKGKDKLVRLGDVAEVRRGFTTGANEFFYLDAEAIRRWGIEDEFLKPVIKSPRECKSILIDPNQLKFKLFMCGKDKEDLEGTAALEYIEWGESLEYDRRPSCSGRARWWDLGQRQVPRLAFNYLISSTARTLYAQDGCFTGDNFQEIHANSGLTQSLCVSLNSSLFQLMVNMAGRSNFGGGLLKIQTYEVSELLCLDPATVVFDDETIFASSSWEMLEPSEDRRALDAIVFDALNLTQGERDAVYEGVVKLVEARLSKAKSLQGQ